MSRLLEGALDLAAPPLCAACDKLAPRGGPFCAACASLPQASITGDSVAGVPLWAAGSYAAPLSDAIRRFKYGNRPDLARPLSRLVTPALSGSALFTGELLVPVPLHPLRLAERGYNQAALLAAELARASGLRSRPVALARLEHTTPQVGRSRAQRFESVAGAFAARKSARIQGRKVIVIDDVATTGATLAACIGALEAAGADVRGALLLARAAETGADS